MSRLHYAYAVASERGDNTRAAHPGDCIGGKCPCRVLSARLTWTQRISLAVMVLGLLGFVVGIAERLGVF